MLGDAELGVVAVSAEAITYFGFGQKEQALGVLDNGVALAQQAGEVESAQRLSELASIFRNATM